MTEKSRFWEGTTVGDAIEAPYNSYNEFARVLNSMTQGEASANKGGVFRETGFLAVTGIASPVSIAVGSAMVHGTWYNNDGAVSVAIPTPAAGQTRVDRIVLRKSWAAQTVRITKIAGTPGAGVPALVQTDGIEWDIPLAQASINDAGVITLTDEREFIIVGNGSITNGQIQDLDASKVYGAIAESQHSVLADQCISANNAATADLATTALYASYINALKVSRAFTQIELPGMVDGTRLEVSFPWDEDYGAGIPTDFSRITETIAVHIQGGGGISAYDKYYCHIKYRNASGVTVVIERQGAIDPATQPYIHVHAFWTDVPL